MQLDVGDLRARAVEFTAAELVVTLADGRKIATPLDWYPRLKAANSAVRMNYEIGAMGIHWPALDEDLSIAAMFERREGSSTSEHTLKSLAPMANERRPKTLDGIYLSHEFGPFVPSWAAGGLGTVQQERIVDLTVIENYLEGKVEYSELYKSLLKSRSFHSVRMDLLQACQAFDIYILEMEKHTPGIIALDRRTMFSFLAGVVYFYRAIFNDKQNRFNVLDPYKVEKAIGLKGTIESLKEWRNKALAHYGDDLNFGAREKYANQDHVLLHVFDGQEYLLDLPFSRKHGDLTAARNFRAVAGICHDQIRPIQVSHDAKVLEFIKSNKDLFENILAEVEAQARSN